MGPGEGHHHLRRSDVCSGPGVGSTEEVGKEALGVEVGGRTWRWIECRAAGVFGCIGEMWSRWWVLGRRGLGNEKAGA